jgi:hypothetical protein
LPRLMLRTSPVFIDRRGATAFVISLCRRKIRFHWCGKTIAYFQTRAGLGVGGETEMRYTGERQAPRCPRRAEACSGDGDQRPANAASLVEARRMVISLILQFARLLASLRFGVV